jgi:hypothetical protein
MPQVNKAADILRKETDKVSKRLQEVGIIEKGIIPRTSRNYFTRIYDTKKMLEPDIKEQFIDTVSEHLVKWNQEGNLRKTPLETDEALERTEGIYDNIMGFGDRAMEFNSLAESVEKKGRFTRSRTLNIPDKILEPYLVNDAVKVTSSFVSRGLALAESKAALQRMGHESLADLRKSMETEFQDILGRAKTQKELVKAKKDFNENIILVNKMYSAFNGTLRKADASDRYVDILLGYQFTRLLGGSMISQMPEMMASMSRLGLGSPLYRSIGAAVRDIESFKASSAELRSLDIGTELLTNSSVKALTGTSGGFGSFEDEATRAVSFITDKFGKVSGLTYITQFHRVLAGHGALAGAARDLKKASTWSAKKRTLYASGGIGDKEVPKIVSQIDKYSDKRNGSFIPNLHLWDDVEARKAFSQFIQAQVESIIIKPGRGDIPFFAQGSTWGKVIFQFKSFLSAATTRITLSGLQRRDAETVAGIFAMGWMGALGQSIKDVIAGREVEKDPLKLWMNGFSYAGLGGLAGTVLLDIAAMGLNQKSRRYVGKFGQGQILGPSFGEIQDLFDLYGRLTDGNVAKGDALAMSRLLPFQNLFYLQPFVKKGIEESFD